MPGFALGFRYLTGYAVATDPASRDAAEWPPHPGRVFMALAAAHFETGESPAERAALEWLESLEPPLLRVSDADPRTVVTHFVPVNNKAGPSKAPLQSAPEFTRERAGRTFPRVRPREETAYLVWPNAAPSATDRAVLEQLCPKVIRVGHSSSLVQMWYADGMGVRDATLEPTGGTATVHLRIAGPGTLAYLKGQYNREAVETFVGLAEAITTAHGPARRAARDEFKRVSGEDWTKSLAAPQSRRPVLSLWQGYRRVVTEPHRRAVQTIFDPDMVVLRLQPKDSRYQQLDLVTTLRVTDVFRRAIQQVADKDLKLGSLPEVVTGHKANGEPSDRPHLAYLPLAFVGDRHASGHLMGLSVAVPREEHWPEHRKERRLIMTLLARVPELTLGRLGVWELAPELRETPPLNLLPDTWTAFPSGERRWASVTPVVFDEHPKEKDRSAYLDAVAGMVRRACVRIGLPEPAGVAITSVSAHLGVPVVREFPRLARKDGGERRHAHVILEFDQAVVGPVVLGAGRYRGYGICRPLRDSRESGE